MAIDCDPSALAESAKCFCFPKDVEQAVIIYLLAQIASNTMTPSELAAAAAPYTGMPKNVQEAAIVYLACAASSAAGA